MMATEACPSSSWTNFPLAREHKVLILVQTAHPEIALLVARERGVKAGDCLVIEDSPAAVAATLAAGMDVIAITTELTRQKSRDTDLLDRSRVVDHPRTLPTIVRRRMEAYRLE